MSEFLNIMIVLAGGPFNERKTMNMNQPTHTIIHCRALGQPSGLLAWGRTAQVISHERDFDDRGHAIGPVRCNREIRVPVRVHITKPTMAKQIQPGNMTMSSYHRSELTNQ